MGYVKPPVSDARLARSVCCSRLPTSIGVVTDDNACWYNVFIDDSLVRISGNIYGSHTYTLASGLKVR